MKRLILSLALCTLLHAATVSRTSIAAVEISLNKRLQSMIPGEPFLVLGEPQGVYLDNYGVVFTANMNLSEGPTANPFRQSVSPKERADLRQRKLDRLPKLRDFMREALIVSAGMLDTIPPQEQIVLAVSLSRYHYEDTAGLPSQIIMQANRLALVNLQVNPPKDVAGLMAVIRTKEY